MNDLDQEDQVQQQGSGSWIPSLELLVTVLGGTALLALVIGLSLAPNDPFPWQGLLVVHFVNVWIWIGAYISVSRAYRSQRNQNNPEAASVLFLLSLLTIALVLSAVHNGLLLASSRGIQIAETVYKLALTSPLVQALPHVLIAVGGLTILVTMRKSSLPRVIHESDETRVIRRLNTELNQEKQKLQTVVQGIQAGLAMVDSEGVIMWANEIYTRWFGKGEPLSGQGSMKVLGVSDADIEEWPHSKLGADGKSMAQCELRLTMANGEVRPFLISAYNLNDDRGEVMGHLQLLQDVSQEKAMQAQLIESEKLSAVGQLIGGVAHELNNPLAILIGYSELAIADKNAPEGFKNMIESIRRNTVRCQKVVKNLLSFVRRHKDERTLTSIREPMAAVLELKRHQLKVENIEVEIDCPHDVTQTMLDEHRLQQVFLNLVNNAHDAIAETGREGKIELSARSEGGFIIAKVSDDGPGIPESLREKVMSPFFTTKALGRGTGLGLAICRSIVEEHNGTLTLESEVGKGSTFTIRLPLRTAAGVTQVVKPQSAAPPSKILLVDDEPEIVELLSRILEDAGHNCVTENDALSGLERLAAGEPFDLIMCDLKMPDLDGMAFLRRVQRDHVDTVKHFVFLSGDTANPRTREQVESRGVSMIEKPYDREEILAAVSKTLLSSDALGTASLE